MINIHFLYPTQKSDCNRYSHQHLFTVSYGKIGDLVKQITKHDSNIYYYGMRYYHRNITLLNDQPSRRTIHLVISFDDYYNKTLSKLIDDLNQELSSDAVKLDNLNEYLPYKIRLEGECGLTTYHKLYDLIQNHSIPKLCANNYVSARYMMCDQSRITSSCLKNIKLNIGFCYTPYINEVMKWLETKSDNKLSLVLQHSRIISQLYWLLEDIGEIRNGNIKINVCCGLSLLSSEQQIRLLDSIQHFKLTDGNITLKSSLRNRDDDFQLQIIEQWNNVLNYQISLNRAKALVELLWKGIEKFIGNTDKCQNVDILDRYECIEYMSKECRNFNKNHVSWIDNIGINLSQLIYDNHKKGNYILTEISNICDCSTPKDTAELLSNVLHRGVASNILYIGKVIVNDVQLITSPFYNLPDEILMHIFQNIKLDDIKYSKENDDVNNSIEEYKCIDVSGVIENTDTEYY